MHSEETNQVPKKLYKYFGNIQYAIDAIERKSVFVESPVHFNDPFDETLCTCNPSTADTMETIHAFVTIVQYFLTSEDYLKKYWGSINFEETLQKLQNDILTTYKVNIKLQDAIHIFVQASGFDKIDESKILEDIKQKKLKSSSKQNICNAYKRVSCFCEVNDSILMWAYYGRNHQGICLEYDTSLLHKNKNHIHQVQYYTNRQNSNNYTTKAKIWEHEKEWRLVLPDDYNNIGGFFENFDCLSGVYLGAQFDFSDTPDKPVRSLFPCSLLNKRYSLYYSLINAIQQQKHDVVLYKATLDPIKYELHFDQFYKYTAQS